MGRMALCFVGVTDLGLTSDVDWALTYVARVSGKSSVRDWGAYINKITGKNNQEPRETLVPSPVSQILEYGQ